MNENDIKEVASVLNDWNPLGSKSANIDGFDEYIIEAIDIIATVGHFQGEDKYKNAIKQVLDQAFELDVSGNELEIAAFKIKAILS